MPEDPLVHESDIPTAQELYVIRFFDDEGNFEHVGTWDNKILADNERTRLLAHLDQKVVPKLSAEVVRVKSVEELLLEWA